MAIGVATCAVLLLLVSAVGCGPPGIVDGKERIYAVLDSGHITYANEALKNIWDIGPRASPAYFNPITWTEDPYDDKYWRFIFYSLRPTTNLLFGYYVTGNTAYRDKLVETLRSYVAADLSRPDNWASFADADDRQPFDDKHTSGWRALVLVNTYGKLRRSGDMPSDLDALLVQDLQKLGTFLADDRNFEDGENHGFNEAAGLLAIAANLPELPDAATWQQLALDRLDLLMHDTVDDDGVEIENSPFYHFYVLTFVLQDIQWGQDFNVAMGDDFATRVGNMLKYATYIPQPSGQIPLQGASVDFNVGELNDDVYADDDLPPLPPLGQPNFDFIRSGGRDGTAPPSSARSLLFPISGQAILRSGFAGGAQFAAETHIAMNVGGWRSKHNHLDVLGLTYYSAGKSLLVDSGLYTYDITNDATDFDYFFGTRAHNTVVVDGGDQSPGFAPELTPNDPAYTAAAAPLVQEGLSTQGTTFSYQSGAHELYGDVTHRRAVVLIERDVALVVDTLSGTQTHDYAQTWHFYPGAQVALDGVTASAADGDGGAPRVKLIPAAGGASLSPVLVTRRASPMQGFYSAQYGVQSANTALEYHTTATATQYATLIVSGPAASQAATVTATFGADGSTVNASICAAGSSFAVSIAGLAKGAAGETVTVTPGPACAAE